MFALFEQAIANTLKYPKIRLQTTHGNAVVLSRAGAKSKYTGQIMITDGRPYGQNTYYGRIDTHGTFHASAQSNSDITALLSRLASNPVDAARNYGRLTGNCCFCDMKLTDARSTANGYGPVCAKRFGLQWDI